MRSSRRRYASASSVLTDIPCRLYRCVLSALLGLELEFVIRKARARVFPLAAPAKEVMVPRSVASRAGWRLADSCDVGTDDI